MVKVNQVQAYSPFRWSGNLHLAPTMREQAESSYKQRPPGRIEHHIRTAAGVEGSEDRWQLRIAGIKLQFSKPRER